MFLKCSAFLTLLALSMVDVCYPSELGDRRTVTGCHMRAEASWSGSFFNPCKRGKASNSCIHNPSSCGWAIVNYKPVITSKTAGSYKASLVSGQAEFAIMTTTAINEYINTLIEAAAQTDKGDIKVQLEDLRSESFNEFSSYYNNGAQTLVGSVSTEAQGSCVDRKRGWIEMHFEIEEEFVGCTPSDLTSKLESNPDFALVKKAAGF